MIREATLSDLDEMVEFGRLLHKESQEVASFSPDETRKLMIRYITDSNKIIFVDREYKGALLAFHAKYDFSTERYAFEQYWFVKKKYRGGPTGIRLYKAFEQWATDIGARELRFGIGTGVKTDATGAMLEKLGHKYIGGFYKKEL